MSPAEWAAFLRTYEELVAGADAVALCGSLPPGIHVGAYAELVRIARAAAVPVLLDTSGEPLRRGIAARPDLVKPNAEELARLTGSREPLRAAGDARRRGAHAVVASLGPEGVLALTPGRRLAGGPARPRARQPDRRGRLRGRRAALRPGRGPALAGAPGPGGGPVHGDGAGPDGRRVRRGGLTRNCCRASRWSRTSRPPDRPDTPTP